MRQAAMAVVSTALLSGIFNYKVRIILYSVYHCTNMSPIDLLSENERKSSTLLLRNVLLT